MSRVNFRQAAPDVRNGLIALEEVVRKSSLDHKLIDLVYLRVSQLNGCAFCVDQHWHELVKAGESPARLNLLMVWHESQTFFTKRERAALAWAEAVTLVATHHGVSDAVYEEALAEFGDKGLAELDLAVAMINAWNRFGIPFQLTPPNR